MKKVNERQSHREYWAWAAMLQRCNNQKCTQFKNYGARGISVCAAWHSYDNFIADMGPRPSPKHSLDRIDNNGNYEPSNCRWTDSKTQTRNMRRNTVLELNGERKLLCDWAEHYGLRSSLICNRMNKLGWSIERSLTTPADKNKYRRGEDSIAAKAKAAGMHRNMLYARLKRGIPLEEALKR
jgi:hypothetical protein